MPPKSARHRMRSGGVPPPSSRSQAAAAPLLADPDPAFEFLAIIPSPVTLPPSQPARSGAAPSVEPLSQAEAAVPPSSAASGDPYAFIAHIPSPVVLPPSQKGQGSGIKTGTVAVAPPVSPALYPPSQLATLPAHIAAGDSATSFMASAAMLSSAHSGQGVDNISSLCTSFDARVLVEPQASLQDDDDEVMISDSPSHVSAAVEEDELESVVSIPETGASATSELHSQTAELLARRLSYTPPVQADAHRLPLSLEDRLREAQSLIDQELDELASLRSDLSRFNDVLLQHSLVLRSVKNNFLR